MGSPAGAGGGEEAVEHGSVEVDGGVFPTGAGLGGVVTVEERWEGVEFDEGSIPYAGESQAAPGWVGGRAGAVRWPRWVATGGAGPPWNAAANRASAGASASGFSHSTSAPASKAA